MDKTTGLLDVNNKEINIGDIVECISLTALCRQGESFTVQEGEDGYIPFDQPASFIFANDPKKFKVISHV